MSYCKCLVTLVILTPTIYEIDKSRSVVVDTGMREPEHPQLVNSASHQETQFENQSSRTVLVVNKCVEFS